MSHYWEDILNLLLCRAPYAGYRTAMSGRLLSPSSSVFCAAKYRGGVRKDGGVNLYRKKLMKPFQSLSSKTTVPSVSPLLLPQHRGCNPSHSLKFRSIPTKFLLSRLSFPRLGRKIYHYTTHRRSGNTLPQIGEVLRSDEGGKRNDISK